jgi:type VI secretion system protein ImpH
MDPVLRELLREPWRFEFPQAMRVLLRNSDHGNTMLAADRRYDVVKEPVRIGVHQSLAFPASDVQSLTPGVDGKAEMSINFLGLTGPSGVLPLHYTEFLMDRARDGDHSPAEFLDIFNHRMAMLFYYAWEKYRFSIARERRPDHDMFRQILLSLAGLGTEHLQRRQFTSDEFFAKYASILAIQQRSASSLETILTDYFNVPVDIQQFAGDWYLLEDDSTTRFRDDDSESERLGYGVVVGDEYWSQEFMARVRIGPLDLSTFKRFLRGGPDLLRIEEICRFFSRGELNFEIQLVLLKDEIPETRLSVDEGPDDSRLGWTTWAKSQPVDEDAGNVTIRFS